MQLHIVDEVYVEVTSNNSDESLIFDISQYKSTKMPLVDELFTEVNSFFSELRSTEQEEIFGAYKECRDYLDVASKSNQIEGELRNNIGIIYKHLTFSNLMSWIKRNRRIRYPDNCPDRHELNDKNPDKTYLKSDYFELSIMTLMLRIMVPIWGEYIRLVEIESGATNKEYIAFRLLDSTEIPNLEPFHRLKRYIENIRDFPSFSSNPTVSISASIPSSRLIYWLMYITIFRRLSCGLIDSDGVRAHLVSSVHTYVTGLIARSESKFDPIKSKQNPNTDEDKPILDLIRPRQEESIGDMAIHAVYLFDRGSVIVDIDDTVSPDLIAGMMREKIVDIEAFQVIITQLVLSIVMSPFSINAIVAKREISLNIEVSNVDYSDSGEVIHNPLHDAITITKTILWHWGYPVLSLLMNATRNHDDDLFMENIDRISSASLAELQIYFPYSRKKGSNDRQLNVAYVDIVELSKMIGQGGWNVTYPPSIADDAEKHLDVAKRLHVPSDIQEQLARLVIDVAKLKQKLGVTQVAE